MIKLNNISMNRILVPALITVLLLSATTTASAQKRKKQEADTLSSYREFVSLGKWYLNTPLQIKVHLISRTIPLVRQEDNMEADMLLYYGRNNFYIQAGDLEQIVNDSLTVLINNEAKIMKIFSNTHTLGKTMEQIIPSFVPDSSLQKLSLRYSIEIQDEGKDIKKMTVQSRQRISGTAFSKETITITYRADSLQPLNYYRSQRSLIPVDSTVYNEMTGNPLYTGRLVTSKAAKGDLFFVMKEKTTECRFNEVIRQEALPTALQRHRIDRTESGEYIPAKGFEGYLVSTAY